MKYVVFALLFSVTTTLNLSGQASGNATVIDSNSSTVKDNIVVNNVTEPIPNVTDIPKPNSTTPIPPTTTTSPPTTTATSTTTPPTTPVSTSTVPPTSSTPSTTTTPKPVPTPSTTVPTTTKVTSSTPPHSSMNPIDPTTAAPSHHDRKFDGPSFVGGIVLALGLVAIGFVAFKFYKARTESNYHTL